MAKKIADYPLLDAVDGDSVLGHRESDGKTVRFSRESFRAAQGDGGDFDGDVAAALLLKAPLASPAFTGTPTVPTAAAGDNSTKAASTAFATAVAQAAAAAIVNSSPAALDTLNELAAALGNDPNFATSTAAALGLKAPLASPAFTGTPTVPTAVAGDNSTKAASTAFATAVAQAAAAAIVNSSPAALDTLNELAAALGNDPNFAASIATSLGLKAPLASPALTGSPTAPTATAGDSSTLLATTAFVAFALSAKASLAGPAFTGAPTAPTPGVGDSSTKLATTAFAMTAAANAAAAIVASSPAALDTLNELAAALGNDPNFAASIASSLGLKAPLASPTFTGTPTVPTATAGDSSTKAASTAFVAAVKALVDAAKLDKSGDTATNLHVAGDTDVQGSTTLAATSTGTGATHTLDVSKPLLTTILSVAATCSLSGTLPVAGRIVPWLVNNPTAGPLPVTLPTGVNWYSPNVGTNIGSFVVAAGDTRYVYLSRPLSGLYMVQNEQPAALPSTFPSYTSFPGGSDAVGYPIAAFDWATMGGSVDARGQRIRSSSAGNATLTGTVANGITTGILTVVTQQTHKLHGGALVQISAETQNSAFDYIFARGAITYVNSTTFTIPYVGPIAPGTNTSALSVHWEQGFGHASYFQDLNGLLGLPLNYVGCFATGSNNLSHMIPRVPAIIAAGVKVVFGGLGVGNSITYFDNNPLDADPATATAMAISQIAGQYLQVVDPLGKAGINVIYMSAQAALSGAVDADKYVLGIEVDKAIAILNRSRRWITTVTRYPDTTNPFTGFGYPNFFRGGEPGLDGSSDGIHPNEVGSESVAKDVVDSIYAILPRTGKGIFQTILDRRAASSLNNQIIDSGWVATGNNPALLDTGGVSGASRFSGLAWAEITQAVLDGVNGTAVTGESGSTGSGSTGATVLFSVVPRYDPLGIVMYYEQWVKFTGVSGDRLIIVLDGAAGTGNKLKDKVSAGSYYAGAVEYGIAQSVYRGVRSHWIEVQATMNYGFGSISGKLAAPITNDVDNIEYPLQQSYFKQRQISRHRIPPAMTGITAYGVAFGMILNSACTATFVISRIALSKVA